MPCDTKSGGKMKGGKGNPFGKKSGGKR